MQVISKSKVKKWTVDEYLKTPEGVYFEIINGIRYMAASPFRQHQRISRDLGYLLLTHTRKHNLGEIFYAPLDVVFDEDNVVQPDLIFIAKGNKIFFQEGIIHGAPDVLIEIISRSSIKKDRNEKMKLYCRFGVMEYWIVDPVNRAVEIYLLKDGVYLMSSFATESGEVKSTEIKNFKLKIEDFMPAKAG